MSDVSLIALVVYQVRNPPSKITTPSNPESPLKPLVDAAKVTVTKKN